MVGERILTKDRLIFGPGFLSTMLLLVKKQCMKIPWASIIYVLSLLVSSPNASLFLIT